MKHRSSEEFGIGVVRETAEHLTLAPELITAHGILFNCDCMLLFSGIRDGSVDLVFADPPFNLGKDYGTSRFQDVRSENGYLQWCKAWLTESIRVLKPGGSLFIYNIPKWLIPIGAYLNEFLEFRHWIALTMKNNYPRGNRLYPAHYGLLYYTKGRSFTFNRLRVPVPKCRHCAKDLRDYGGHRDKLNPEGLNLTDFWDDTSPVRHSKFKKRASNELKPIIPRRAILIASNEGDIVLDPFGGGGSTFEEAEKTGRLWVGSEIGNCAPIRERLGGWLPFEKPTPNQKLTHIFTEPAQMLSAKRISSQ
jgi:site-specific DNA-methyltransferase (adenine-specific)